MTAAIARKSRLCAWALAGALSLLLPSMPARADDLSDFHDALDEASEQYEIALTTLETRGQDETAAQVQHLRQTWQAFVTRFGAKRPVAFKDDEAYTTTLLDVDVRLVGVLLTIDMGNRDAARAGLNAVHDILGRLNESTSPPPH